MSEAFYVTFVFFIMLSMLVFPHVFDEIENNEKLDSTAGKVASVIVGIVTLSGISAICYFIGHWLHRTFSL